MNPPSEETFLVLRAQSDDREALETLLRRVHPSLPRYHVTRMTKAVLRAIALSKKN